MGLFSFRNKKLRCPQCGSFNEHKKGVKTASHDETIDMMRELMSSIPSDSLLHKASAEAMNNYICIKCSHVFTENLSHIWKDIADKHSESFAIKEYINS